MIVDVVVLSNCTSAAYFTVNNDCIDSLIASEDNYEFNIIVIESNPEFPGLLFDYPQPNVRVLIPGEPFNFNRFLNIGLAESNHEWIIFCNNDILFHKNWITEIFKIKQQHPLIRSFSPFDRHSKYLKWNDFNKQPFHAGYRIAIEFTGWCFVVERSIFEQTGPFDEQFDLYFQDNDFACTLQSHGILHAMVSTSFVEHIGGYTTKSYDASHTVKYSIDKKKFLKKWEKDQVCGLGKKIYRRVKKLGTFLTRIR